MIGILGSVGDGGHNARMHHTAPNEPVPGRVPDQREVAREFAPAPSDEDGPGGVAGLIDQLDATDPAHAPDLADRIARLLSDRLDAGTEPEVTSGAGQPGGQPPDGKESPA